MYKIKTDKNPMCHLIWIPYQKHQQRNWTHRLPKVEKQYMTAMKQVIKNNNNKKANMYKDFAEGLNELRALHVLKMLYCGSFFFLFLFFPKSQEGKWWEVSGQCHLKQTLCANPNVGTDHAPCRSWIKVWVEAEARGLTRSSQSSSVCTSLTSRDSFETDITGKQGLRALGKLGFAMLSSLLFTRQTPTLLLPEEACSARGCSLLQPGAVVHKVLTDRGRHSS